MSKPTLLRRLTALGRRIAGAKARTPTNRIVFAGSPWPRGHAIKHFRWTARLEDDRLWFDLSLSSESYDDEENEEDDSPEDREVSDWESKLVWANYNACILSSNDWPGNHTGWCVATRSAPLVLTELVGRRFHVDALSDRTQFEDPPFGIYLFGHNSTADHHIKFSRGSGIDAFDISWCGKIAPTESARRVDFTREFEAQISSVRLERVRVPETMSEDQAREILRSLLTGLPRMNYEAGKWGGLIPQYPDQAL